MNYQYALTIPAGTTQDDPEIIEDSLPFGVIGQVSLSFTPEDCRQSHVAIFHAEQKILPTNPDEWYKGHYETLRFPEAYALPSAHNRIVIKGYTDDTLFDHEVVVRLSLLGPIESALMMIFERLLGRLPIIGG